MRQAMNLFRTACLSNCYNNIMIMHKAMVRMVNTGNWLSERKGERERGKWRERREERGRCDCESEGRNVFLLILSQILYARI